MVHFPGESAEYRAARDSLLEAECALRRQIEAVAEQRRALPPGGALKENYVFAGASIGEPEAAVGFSELFAPGQDTLVIHGFMYTDDSDPCPMCSAFLDSFNGAVRHIREQASVAVVAKAGASRLRDWAERRGWGNLRLFSSAGTSFNTDYHAEAPDGGQLPMVNVFHRTTKGIHHFHASELFFAPSEPGQNPRHVDMLWPLWHTLDLTPDGRGDWYPSLSHGAA